MMIFLENHELKVSLHPKGAELQSLYNKVSGIEYMWNGNAVFWGKHSPILFPVVGSLKEDSYTMAGVNYKLPRHGFAREKTFSVESQSATSVVFMLQSDESTLLVYPFHFELRLRYVLSDGSMTCTYEVRNRGERTMLFSVGGHPAFAIPFVVGTTYRDYFLRFKTFEKLERWKLKDGLIDDHAGPLLLEGDKLWLDPVLFYEDAIVLKGMVSDEVSIESQLHSHGLRLRFKGFPYFGIWAAKDAAFVCLEPWCGIADSVNTDQHLEKKEGINELAAGEIWNRQWTLETY